MKSLLTITALISLLSGCDYGDYTSETYEANTANDAYIDCLAEKSDGPVEECHH